MNLSHAAAANLTSSETDVENIERFVLDQLAAWEVPGCAVTAVHDRRPVTALAPAGAVNSCAADMARWLLAQLGGGQVDGRAVMSPGTVARQHAPHIVLPEDRTFPVMARSRSRSKTAPSGRVWEPWTSA